MQKEQGINTTASRASPPTTSTPFLLRFLLLGLPPTSPLPPTLPLSPVLSSSFPLKPTHTNAIQQAPPHQRRSGRARRRPPKP